MTSKQVVTGRSKPRGVTRLGRDITGKAPAEGTKKAVRPPAIERQTRWKLHEKAAKTLSERRNLEEKRFELRVGPNESLEVRDRLGDLH